MSLGCHLIIKSLISRPLPNAGFPDLRGGEDQEAAESGHRAGPGVAVQDGE